MAKAGRKPIWHNVPGSTYFARKALKEAGEIKVTDEKRCTVQSSLEKG